VALDPGLLNFLDALLIIPYSVLVAQRHTARPDAGSSNTTMQITDYKPVLLLLCRVLSQHGYLPRNTDDGGDVITTTTAKDVAAVATSVDTSHIRFSGIGGKRLVAFIVLGNSAEETVCDYGPSNVETDTAMDDFANRAAFIESFGEELGLSDFGRAMEEWTAFCDAFPSQSGGVKDPNVDAPALAMLWKHRTNPPKLPADVEECRKEVQKLMDDDMANDETLRDAVTDLLDALERAAK